MMEKPRAGARLPETKLPLYRNTLDWDWFSQQFPAPDVWAETIFKWPADRVRELQNRRFLSMMAVGLGQRVLSGTLGGRGPGTGGYKQPG